MPGLEIQRIGGLIKHQHIGLVHQGAGNQQPPALAFRELAKPFGCQLPQTQLVHQLSHPLPHRRCWVLAAADAHRAKATGEHHIGGPHSRVVEPLQVAGDQANALTQLPEIHRAITEQAQA